MFGFLKDGFFSGIGGRNDNLRERGKDFRQPRRREYQPTFDRFGCLLPYTGWDDEYRLFPIEGATRGEYEGLGFALEIRPQTGADETMANAMLNMLSGGLPPGTGIQAHMFGSPILGGLFGLMKDQVVDPDTADSPEQSELLHALVDKRVAYYQKATLNPLFNNFNYRMRNFECVLSVVVPVDDALSQRSRRDVASIRDAMIATLNQFYLYERDWGPAELINFLTLILNPHRTLAGDYPYFEYDPLKEIRQQIIAHDTQMDEDETEMIYSGGGVPDAAIRLLSVRSAPGEFGLNNMVHLLGSAVSTAITYPCPFLLTVGIAIPSFDAAKNQTMLKAARAQQTAESQLARFVPNVAEVNEDWKTAQRAFDEGKGTVRMYHQLLLMCHPEQLRTVEEAARGVWRAEKFDIVCDRKMQKQALLGSLPMLFGPLLQRDMKQCFRTSTRTMYNAANMLPIIGEWTGTPPRSNGQFVPLIVTFGHRGQAMSVDIFANPSGNNNGVVVGTSGSGKSALLNELIWRILATGGRVWIIDVGRSYEKLCRLLGGQFIEFVGDAGIQLNPFSLVTNIDEDMEMLKPVIAQMISPSGPLDDYELAQLEIHIRSVWFEHGPDSTLTHLAQSLIHNCSAGGPNPVSPDEWAQHLAELSHDERQKMCDIRIRDLGIQLFPFTEDGAYGKWFSGKCNIKFSSNFIVLELEELKAKKDLQAVVMQILMYQITNTMYLSDRNQAKLVIIDEAWDLMGSGNSGSFIEAGYRRARKYRGAFFTATQSVGDYYKSPTALAAFDNADWVFLLRQKRESIEALSNSNKLVMDEHTKKMISGLTTVEGRYSEVFIRGGDLPPAVGRLFFDPFTLLVASSKPDDQTAVYRYTNQGLSIKDAVNQVLLDRGVTL